LAWFAVALTTLSVATLELVLQANLARAPLANAAMFGLVASFLVFTVLWLALLERSFRPPTAR
jgi:hypothetical protein